MMQYWIFAEKNQGPIAQALLTWRTTDYSGDEQGEDLKVVLLGSVPYEYVDSVDWEGDEFYQYPHIYCHFNHKGEPYEHLGFAPA